MNSARKLKPFWRRKKQPKARDIAILKPATRAKSDRFETLADAVAESMRSERALKSTDRASLVQQYLCECRTGYYGCEKTYCPLCARAFRRWFIGETIAIANQCPRKCQVITLLLAKSQDIHDLDPADYRSLIRRRLDQAGLDDTPVIGGFEMVYRARDKTWVLHINLLFLGEAKLALSKFEESFASAPFVRPTQTVPLKDLPEQISYLLKFTTYHRPWRQTGPKRSPAKPLNAREHVVLVNWMSRYEFTDMMFLYGVRREGTRLRRTVWRPS
jgi:hypothetical protein